mgnify:CR=1 FL=1
MFNWQKILGSYHYTHPEIDADSNDKYTMMLLLSLDFTLLAVQVFQLLLLFNAVDHKMIKKIWALTLNAYTHQGRHPE